MFLDSQYYELKNALNCRIFQGHLDAFKKPGNSLGCKVFHVCMMLAECPPIIGQIIALFELAIAKTFQDKKKFTNETERANSYLLSFYQGNGMDIEGRTLSEIWAFSDDKKESAHDYIQWLFPLNQASAYNPRAPVLVSKTSGGNPSLNEIMRQDAKVTANLRRSFEVMLKFFGLGYDPINQKVYKDANFNKRTKVWLTPDNHNFKRITRILTCLVNFGLQKEASALLEALREIKAASPGPVSTANFKHWERAVWPAGFFSKVFYSSIGRIALTAIAGVSVWAAYRHFSSLVINEQVQACFQKILDLKDGEKLDGFCKEYLIKNQFHSEVDAENCWKWHARFVGELKCPFWPAGNEESLSNGTQFSTPCATFVNLCVAKLRQQFMSLPRFVIQNHAQWLNRTGFTEAEFDACRYMACSGVHYGENTLTYDCSVN